MLALTGCEFSRFLRRPRSPQALEKIAGAHKGAEPGFEAENLNTRSGTHLWALVLGYGGQLAQFLEPERAVNVQTETSSAGLHNVDEWALILQSSAQEDQSGFQVVVDVW